MQFLKVVELGDTVTASAAGAVFRRLGARVTKVRAVSGRPRAQSGTQIERLQAVLDREKSIVSVRDLFGAEAFREARQADITVADLTASDYWSDSGALDQYEREVASQNSAVWVTVLPFGLHGPRRRYRGTELTVAASGGVVHYMRSSDGRPMKPAGFTASITAGHFAALAGFHGTLLHRERGRSLHLDLSLQDSVVVSSAFLECAHQLFDCPGPGGIWRHSPPSGIIACGTGMIWIVAIEEHHWRGVVRAIGDPSWASSVNTSEDRRHHADLINDSVRAWAAHHSAREAARRLQAEGVPATSVNSCRDLLEAPGLEVRESFFVPGESGPNERLPGVPAALTPLRVPHDAQRSIKRADRPYRLLDLTHVLAGPLATSWLGAMGIDVLKIEDPGRPDFYRRIGPFMRGVRTLETCAYFAAANYSKRSFAIGLDSTEGRARLGELISSADLVVENLGRHRAEGLGLTEAALETYPLTTLVSSSGFARTVVNAAYRAYGMNIHASGGVIYLSRDRRGQPRNLGTSWGDPMTSVWLAILSIAQLLLPPHERSHIDLSMVESVAYLFPEYFSLLTADGTELLADESRLDHAAPHGVYRSAGEDHWVAIAVATDHEWQRLRSALGDPAVLQNTHFDSCAGRLARQDELDHALQSVLSAKGRDAIVQTLQARGLACAPVMSATDLVSDDHLRSRELFQTVLHPQWGHGQLAGLPWRIVGEGPVRIGPTPLLGQHTTTDARRIWLARAS